MKKETKHVCKCAGKCSKSIGDKIVLVKVGSDERPATQKDIENIQGQLAQIAKDPNLALVTHNAIQVEVHPLKSYMTDHKSFFLIQAPNATEAEAKVMNADIKKLLSDAGVDSIVYVTKHSLLASQFNFEVK